MPDDPTTTPAADTPPPAPPPDPAPPSGAGAGTAVETISREEHQRELDRYRNEVGQAAKRAKELEARLKQLEEANQTEAERLAAQAKRAEDLEPEVERLKAQLEAQTTALLAEVDAQKKALPKEMIDLLPAEASPAEQLAWVAKARAAAEKLKPAPGLAPAGGRQGGGRPTDEPNEAERAFHARHMASRF